MFSFGEWVWYFVAFASRCATPKGNFVKVNICCHYCELFIAVLEKSEVWLMPACKFNSKSIINGFNVLLLPLSHWKANIADMSLDERTKWRFLVSTICFQVYCCSTILTFIMPQVSYLSNGYKNIVMKLRGRKQTKCGQKAFLAPKRCRFQALV